MIDANYDTRSADLTDQLAGDSLLEQILSEARLARADETYAIARQGVEAFITGMLAPDKAGLRVDRAAVDVMIAEIDQRISAQVNVILHAPALQQVESTWRELKFLVDRVDFRENVKVEIINLSKDDLMLDFEDAPELAKSGLYRTV